ncbi:MAG: hypothetical protein ACOZNI_04725 [Myxococcota bacterium]
MRVLLVHHGRFDADAPVTGGALRAATHADALRRAGHEVVTVARAQDEPGGFRSPGHLRRLADRARPDWILCVAPEEAPALAPVAPLVVDLYAPRMLEGAFEGLQREEAGRALRAVAAADEVIVSNPRQRWFWAGLLGACGWDLSAPAGLLVPIAAHPGPPRRKTARPTFVLGGRPWPWQDPADAVRRAVAHLGDRAEVHVYGLPAPPGAHAHDAVPRAEWLDACAGAVAVLDRYAPNPERALAQSFRQMDAVGCGAPLITDADTPLADEVRETVAGWVDEPLEEALDAALARRPKGVAALAARYHPERTEAALLAWVPRRRVRDWDLFRAGGRLARAEAEARAAHAVAEAARAEVAGKRAEIEALNQQVRALASAVEASAAAVADVAAFRRETVQVLGARLAGGDVDNERLLSQMEVLKADLAKKDAELAAAQAERNRLDRTLAFLKGRIAR